MSSPTPGRVPASPTAPPSAAVGEFHYKLPMRLSGQRPGAHASNSLGPGQGFAAHRRLLDHADPRRIDLRASLRDVRGDWLVRIQHQRVAAPVHAVVDVSASMHFGAQRSKLAVVADFVEALGHSAFRAGDPVGLLAFDERARDDLFLPPRHSRGAGVAMAQVLRDVDRAAQDAALGPAPRGGWGSWWRGEADRAARPGVAGPAVAASHPHGHGTLRQGLAALAHGAPHAATAALAAAVARLAGRPGLVFLVSDFHGPLDGLGALLEQFAPAHVVPVIAWDPAETEPPAAQAVLAVSDAETGERRTLWLREPLRQQWRDTVAARRTELHALFEAHGLRPFHLHGDIGQPTAGFEPERLTRYFLESTA